LLKIRVLIIAGSFINPLSINVYSKKNIPIFYQKFLKKQRNFPLISFDKLMAIFKIIDEYKNHENLQSMI